MTPVGTGTAVLSLTPPAGAPAAASGAQILYTVTEPDLYLPNVNIGVNFQAPLQVRLASRIPAPPTDLTLTIMGDFGISISNGGTLVSYPNTIQVVIPAGQHLSKPFSVQGTALTTATLHVSAPGLTAGYANVHVLAPTFVFQQASSTQSVALTAGGSTNLTILPAVLPLGTPTAPGMAIGGGLAFPVSLGISVGTPSVVSAPSGVTLHPGDQQATITVHGLAPGSSYVALTPTSVYGIPNAQSSVNLAVSAAH
ncbi:MAG TPA: hypothetical protein VKX45_09405 [Bryobacteraceae bacterium]|nr:hypothetical protein [Bryobacteraceae bacterium]